LNEIGLLPTSELLFFSFVNFTTVICSLIKMGNLFTTFTNCRQCINGEVVEGERLVVSQDDGLILKSTGYIGGDIVDLDDAIIAPGFLELHTNGTDGVHYSNYESKEQYLQGLSKVAEGYPKRGVTSFWATVPTVESELYQKV
jgi:N-acetylglucosamine-6-phosphate deacetylase